MQATQLAYLLNPRPQIQVVSVSEKNLYAQLFQQILRNAFHGGLRANGHEDRSLHCAVRCNELPSARGSFGGLNYEVEGHLEVILKERPPRQSKRLIELISLN